VKPDDASAAGGGTVATGGGGTVVTGGGGGAACFGADFGAAMMTVGELSSSGVGAGAASARGAAAGLAWPKSTLPKIFVNSPADLAGVGGGGGGAAGDWAARGRSGARGMTGGAAGASILLKARVKSPGAASTIFGVGGAAGIAEAGLTWSSQVEKSTKELMNWVTATGEPSTSAISTSFSRAGGFSASRRARVAVRCSGVSESR
jgi:hypothetical protein